MSVHVIGKRVQVLDTNEQVVSTITSRILTGQVNVDATAAITRTLQMDVAEPEHELHFDGDSPADGALYSDRMIRASYLLDGTWTDVHTGPVSLLSRAGAVVTIEAQGKEVLASDIPWTPVACGAKMLVVDAIRRIMATAGEAPARMRLPALRARLAHPLVIVRGDQRTYWQVAVQLAASQGYQLYYDGSGILVMRPWPSLAKPLAVYGQGPTGTVDAASIKVDVDTSNLANVVQVTGATPKASKTHKHPAPFRAIAVAPPGHPLSPQRLGRNGNPREIPKFVDAPNLRSNAACLAYAQRILNKSLVAVMKPSFDIAVPDPERDPLDTVRLVTPDFSTTMVLEQFSLPLGAVGPMTIGAQRNVGRVQVWRRRR